MVCVCARARNTTFALRLSPGLCRWCWDMNPRSALSFAVHAAHSSCGRACLTNETPHAVLRGRCSHIRTALAYLPAKACQAIRRRKVSSLQSRQTPISTPLGSTAGPCHPPRGTRLTLYIQRCRQFQSAPCSLQQSAPNRTKRSTVGRVQKWRPLQTRYKTRKRSKSLFGDQERVGLCWTRHETIMRLETVADLLSLQGECAAMP
jgi:hypothetical protein